MGAAAFLQDMTVVLSTAAAILVLFKNLGQPPVLGYLAAGLLIGPHTPPMPFVVDPHSLEILAEVGVVFLLFALGVEFNFGRLAEVGLKALVCAGIETVAMLVFGWALGRALGWNPMESLALGAISALASTAIVARSLLEPGRRSHGWEELTCGILVAEDIIAVLLIALFSSAATTGSSGAFSLWHAGLRFAALITVFSVTSLLLLPRLLKAVEKTDMEEARTLAVIGVCFGLALITRRLGYSAALGAFLAGAMSSLAQSSVQLHKTVAPFKDVFGAVFFVSIGMLIDPGWILRQWPMALGAVFILVLARGMANFAALAVAGETYTAASQASLARLPIGEFSFIMAQMTRKTGLVDKPLEALAVTLCLASTLASSFAAPRASEERIGRLLPSGLKKLLERYRAWITHVSVPTRTRQVWKLLRPSLMQIGLNLAGITGLFLGLDAAWKLWPGNGAHGPVLWMGATFLLLPFLNALTRKIQAVTLVLLEAVSLNHPTGQAPIESWPRLTRLLLALAPILVLGWYLSVSSEFLPPWPDAAAPLFIALAVGALLWRRMNRIYSLIQHALRESLTRYDASPTATAEAYSLVAQARIPEKIKVKMHLVRPHDWACEKTIIKTSLRSRSGATILQVTRSGRILALPTPHLKLEASDELLLIGDSRQLSRAEELLQKG